MSSNNCKHETWRSIHLGYSGTHGVLIVCCYTPTRAARPPGSPVGNRGDYSPGRKNWHGFCKRGRCTKSNRENHRKKEWIEGLKIHSKSRKLFGTEKGAAKRYSKKVFWYIWWPMPLFLNIFSFKFTYVEKGAAVELWRLQFCHREESHKDHKKKIIL